MSCACSFHHRCIVPPGSRGSGQLAMAVSCACSHLHLLHPSFSGPIGLSCHSEGLLFVLKQEDPAAPRVGKGQASQAHSLHQYQPGPARLPSPPLPPPPYTPRRFPLQENLQEIFLFRCAPLNWQELSFSFASKTLEGKPPQREVVRSSAGVGLYTAFLGVIRTAYPNGMSDFQPLVKSSFWQTK